MSAPGLAYDKVLQCPGLRISSFREEVAMGFTHRTEMWYPVLQTLAAVGARGVTPKLLHELLLDHVQYVELSYAVDGVK